MDKQLHSDAAESWPVFEDPQRRFLVRRPPLWRVSCDHPDTTLIQEQQLHAELAVAFLDGDCAAAQKALLARRLNYYFLREFPCSLVGREITAYEFRDTISNVRDFHVFLPAEGRCCHVRWRRSERPQGPELEPILEAMLSTFQLISRKS